MNARPAVLDTVDGLDLMGTPEAATVTGARLRVGMVLLCPVLGTPAAWLDVKQDTAPRSGEVQFLAHNLETGRLTTVRVHRNKPLAVLAD